MAVKIPEFWKLLLDSKLMSADECARLGEEFGQVKGAAKQGNARTLVEWLIAMDKLTRYQAKILLGGRAGPFVYGDYKVTDRVQQGALAGMFRAVHAATNHPVMLHFLTGPVTQDPQLWAAAARRAQAYYTVVHPHLVRCHEIVDLTAFKFMVTPVRCGWSRARRRISMPDVLASAAS